MLLLINENERGGRKDRGMLDNGRETLLSEILVSIIFSLLSCVVSLSSCVLSEDLSLVN